MAEVKTSLLKDVAAAAAAAAEGAEAEEEEGIEPRHRQQQQQQQQQQQASASSHGGSRSKKLTLLPLIFLIFYEVSGGPIGTEGSVKAAGTLLALLGFAVFPFVWSVPEALVTAEMATAFPENGGYVVWTRAAFGPFWGFLQGWWKWVSGVINTATYPLLCLDYAARMVPEASGPGAGRAAAAVGFTLALTYLNYRGLSLVGWAAVALGAASLLPFAVLLGFALPRLRPGRWLSVPDDLSTVAWRDYLNVLFWNLNFWDNASTLAGEVEDPGRTFPCAISAAGLLVSACYLLPLMAATGALDVVRDEWTDGFFAAVALRLAGSWLQWAIELAAVLSCFGLFAAQMSSSSFQVLGMADMGILPSVFGTRSSHGTPTVGILLSLLGTLLLLAFMSFSDIVQSANALYGLGMLLELAAFLHLRLHAPHLHRPFRIPMGFFGCLLMCSPPCALLLFVLSLSSLKVAVIATVATIVGILLYIGLHFLDKPSWMMKFASSSVPRSTAPTHNNSSALLADDDD